MTNDDGKNMSFLDSALKLAAHGLHVFPLVPRHKTPRFKGWQEWATTDQEKIKDMWTKRPACNVGISMKGGFVAVDIDVKNGKRGAESLILLESEGKVFPKTFTQRTPSGGLHYVYRTSVAARNSVQALSPGIDIRGTHGLIVGAGSVNGASGEPYSCNWSDIAPCPEWLEKILASSDRTVHLPSPALGEVNQEYAETRAKTYLEKKDGVEEGTRGSTAYLLGCYLSNLGVDLMTACDLIDSLWSHRCLPPYPYEEMCTVVQNAYSYCRDRGAVEAPETEFDFISSEDEDSVPVATKSLRVSLASIGEEVQKKQLVKGWLDFGALSVVYGPSNCGKSFLTLDLAHSIASGIDWHGNPVTQGCVLYLAAESPGSIRRRMYAIKKRFGLDKHPVPLDMIPLELELFKEKEGTETLIREAKAMSAEYQLPMRLIVVDTLSSVMGGNENDSVDMKLFIKRANEIRRITGAHVLIVHHTGKDVARGARGSNALRGGIDTEIEVIGRASTETNGTARLTKQRDADSSSRIEFGLEDVEIGVDEDGEPVYSAVVAPKTSTRHLTPQAKKVWALLVQLAREEGELPKEGSNIPSPAIVLRAENVVDAVIKNGASKMGSESGATTSDKRKSARRAIERTVRQLGTNGEAGLSKGLIWVICDLRQSDQERPNQKEQTPSASDKGTASL